MVLENKRMQVTSLWDGFLSLEGRGMQQEARNLGGCSAVSGLMKH